MPNGTCWHLSLSLSLARTHPPTYRHTHTPVLAYTEEAVQINISFSLVKKLTWETPFCISNLVFLYLSVCLSVWLSVHPLYLSHTQCTQWSRTAVNTTTMMNVQGVHEQKRFTLAMGWYFFPLFYSCSSSWFLCAVRLLRTKSISSYPV